MFEQLIINKKAEIEEESDDFINENKLLQKKLDKAIDIIVEIANKDYLIDENAKEIFRMCWLRYIEKELEEE